MYKILFRVKNTKIAVYKIYGRNITIGSLNHDKDNGDKNSKDANKKEQENKEKDESNKTQGVDRIQKLFLEKVKEYKEKSGPEGKLIDLSPEIEAEMNRKINALKVKYGGKEGEDMTKFPTFTWTEPHIDPINEQPKQDSDDKKQEKKTNSDQTNEKKQ